VAACVSEAESSERYILMIAEKPSAAERIAKALDRSGTPEHCIEKGVPYFVAEGDRRIVVFPALGHLYTVAQGEGRRSDYPVFSFEWAPRHMVEKNAERTKSFIEVVSELALNADSFIDACDYDVEGSLIGYSILHYACGKAEAARRMKYSTLTDAELGEAYRHLLPALDFSLIEAGRTRHELDWLYGINLSRALTSAIRRAAGMYVPLSTGRVQGPALRFLVQREEQTACFVPTPYWTLVAHIEVEGVIYEAQYEQRTVEVKSEADAVVAACEGERGRVTNREEKRFRQGPPVPFDLGTMQGEAYRVFGYSPRRTGDLAEHLYLNALISYPRTSSQKLPLSINYRSILEGLRREPDYRTFTSELLSLGELKPQEGGKEDPAHPAIYPTGNRPDRKLETSEAKLWDLVVKRFMAVFGEPALKQSVKADIEVAGHRFLLSGRKVLKEGWMRFYKPYVRLDETAFPNVKEGEEVRIHDVTREDKFTSPPPRYNPSSLLKKMEAEGIGTKATRADIIQTLYNRRYIAEDSIKVTELGQGVTQILEEYAPTIVSVKLTRELEERMQRIQCNAERGETVVDDAISRLKPVLENLKSREQEVGRALGEAVRRSRLQENIVGDCPTCKTGKLTIIYSKRTGKRFVGCSNYSTTGCRTTFSLPQAGAVKPTGRFCKACGWPTLTIFRKQKRPWSLCLNPECPWKRWRKRRWNAKSAAKRS
jgi:DNA topoisomerase-1